MSSSEALTLTSFISLLENKRCTFTKEERILAESERKSLEKAIRLVADEPSGGRNHNKNKARTISNDIRHIIGPEVFCLCALSTPPSVLGKSKLGDDYLSSLRRWWNSTRHPEGLTIMAQSFFRSSPTSVPQLEGSRNNLETSGEHVSISPSNLTPQTQPVLARLDLAPAVDSELKDPEAGKVNIK